MSKIANWTVNIKASDDEEEIDVELSDQEFLGDFIRSLSQSKVNIALKSINDFKARLNSCK